MGLLSLVEIKASRPYKTMKRELGSTGQSKTSVPMHSLESILKSVSLGVMLLAVGFVAWRVIG